MKRVLAPGPGPMLTCVDGEADLSGPPGRPLPIANASELWSGDVSPGQSGAIISPKRVSQLCEQSGRHMVIQQAEALRLAVRRHVERAERQVDEGEDAGEVLVESLGLGRVVPPVEGWARKEVAETPVSSSSRWRRNREWPGAVTTPASDLAAVTRRSSSRLRPWERATRPVQRQHDARAARQRWLKQRCHRRCR